MSDSLVFVLHGGADEKAAAELAGALSPLLAYPARLPESGEQGVRFGMGAVCVVLWTPQMSGAARDVLAAVAGALGNVVVLRRAGAATPTEFTDAGFIVLDSPDDAAAEAAAVQSAVAAISRAGAQQSPGRLHGGPSGRAPAPAQPVRASPRARKLAMRSAVGLAATMAIASVVAPIVSPRAAVSGDSGEGDARVGSEPLTLGPPASAASEAPQLTPEAEPITNVVSLPVEAPPVDAPRPVEVARVADQVETSAAISTVAEEPASEAEEAPAAVVEPEPAKADDGGGANSAPAKGAKKGSSASERSEASA